MTRVLTRYEVAGRSIAFLPDNKGWTCRFEIGSDTSDRVYVVARRKGSGTWACSCPGWIRYRHCKHLDRLQPALREVARLQDSGRLRLPAGD